MEESTISTKEDKQCEQKMEVKTCAHQVTKWKSTVASAERLLRLQPSANVCEKEGEKERWRGRERESEEQRAEQLSWRANAQNVINVSHIFRLIPLYLILFKHMWLAQRQCVNAVRSFGTRDALETLYCTSGNCSLQHTQLNARKNMIFRLRLCWHAWICRLWPTVNWIYLNSDALILACMECTTATVLVHAAYSFSARFHAMFERFAEVTLPQNEKTAIREVGIFFTSSCNLQCRKIACDQI